MSTKWQLLKVLETTGATLGDIAGALQILQKGYIEGLATKSDLEKLHIKLEVLEQ